MRRVTIALMALMAWPYLAMAQSYCLSDADCPSGTSCVPSMDCPTCDPVGECPPCEEASTCEANSYPTGDCVLDADCPTGFRCDMVSVPCAEPSWPCDCACEPCPEGEQCPACECPPCEQPDPLPCDPETYGVCTYEPPDCSSDADCQEGFECVDQEICSSTGCACGGCVCPSCPPGTACAPCECPPIEDCVCESETNCEIVGRLCLPGEILCSSNESCPAGWECVVQASPCVCPDCSCLCDSEGDCSDGAPERCFCPPCECVGDNQAYCLPSGWDAVGYGDMAALEEGTSREASVPPSDPNGGGTGQVKDESVSSDDGGCSLAGGRDQGSALGFWLLLGLALAARRLSLSGRRR